MASGTPARDQAAAWRRLQRRIADQAASVEPLELLRLLATGQILSVWCADPAGRRLIVELHGPLTPGLALPGQLAGSAVTAAAAGRVAEQATPLVGGDLVSATSSVPRPIELVSGRLRLEHDRDRQLFLRLGQRVELTSRQYCLLALLVDESGRSLDTDTLARLAWSEGGGNSRSAVRTCISRIRAQLGPAGALIRTAYGGGYRFVAEPPGL
jgi:hypothetical protein